MTVTSLTANVPINTTRSHAPIGRLLRSELRLILRRPRTLIALALLVLVPVIAGIGIATAAGQAGDGASGEGPGAIAAIVDQNGLVLPIFALFMSAQFLLPMVGAMWSADALAGESSTGAMRNLLVAPVGRARLLAVKAFGVAAVSLIGIALMTISGIISGLLMLGGDGMLTMSGTTLDTGPAIGRIMLAAALVAVHVFAVAAIALAISSVTEHPLIVMAVSVGGIIIFGVLNAISALDWLHPFLITESVIGLVDLMRDPVPTDSLTEGVLRGLCYIAIGYSLAFYRMLTKDG
jgi:ABC-2 type transport system permease protein